MSLKLPKPRSGAFVVRVTNYGPNNEILWCWTIWLQSRGIRVAHHWEGGQVALWREFIFSDTPAQIDRCHQLVQDQLKVVQLGL